MDFGSEASLTGDNEKLTEAILDGGPKSGQRVTIDIAEVSCIPGGRYFRRRELTHTADDGGRFAVYSWLALEDEFIDIDGKGRMVRFGPVLKKIELNLLGFQSQYDLLKKSKFVKPQGFYDEYRKLYLRKVGFPFEPG
jgi:hypothetical protein